MSDSATPWIVVPQAPLSMGFSRQEYWSGLPFPSPGDLPNPGLNLCLPHFRQILYCLRHQGSSFLDWSCLVLSVVRLAIFCHTEWRILHSMKKQKKPNNTDMHECIWSTHTHTHTLSPFFFGLLSVSGLYSLPEAQLYSFLWFYKTPVSLNKSFFYLNHLGFCHMQPRSIMRYILSPQFIFLLWYSTFGS